MFQKYDLLLHHVGSTVLWCLLPYQNSISVHIRSKWTTGRMRQGKRDEYLEMFHQTTLMHYFLYSLTICLLHCYPRHVSSINMPIFRRKNCIHTASGICSKHVKYNSVTNILLMNKENCTLKLVDEIILYYDARSKKHQINLKCVSEFWFHTPFDDITLANRQWVMSTANLSAILILHVY